MSLAVANKTVEACHTPEEASRRVWLLTNAPSPYQVELFSAIGRQPGMSLTVRFMRPGSRAGQADASRLDASVMGGLGPHWFRDEIRLHPQAIRECLTGDFDCYVLSGLYTSITFLMCATILTLRRVPWVLWLEQPHPAKPKAAPWSPRILMSRPVQWLRRFVQQRLLNHARRLIAIGSSAKESYRSLGLSGDCIDVVPYCCDIDRFERVDPEQVARFRDRQGWTGRTIFLFSGQMIERKGVDTLLAAFSRLASGSSGAQLVLLGEGPRRGDYESLVSESLQGRVLFAGHVSQAELPLWFRSADVFVFPSRHDGWGVVINEACAARLAVIASRQTGSARDLVEPGVSGVLFERDDVDALVTAMQHFLEHPEDCTLFGNRSRSLVEQFSPEEGAARFRASINKAVDGVAAVRNSVEQVPS